MKNSKMNKKQIIKCLVVFVTLLISASYAFGVEIEFKEFEEFFEDEEGVTWEQSLRYPIVKGNDSKAIKKINDSIQELVNRRRCKPKAEYFFTSVVKYQDDIKISFKYNTSYMCRSMPGPSSYEGGISFNLSSGKTISLKEEVKDNFSYSKLGNTVLAKLLPEIKIKVKNFKACDKPRFSGEFYLEGDNITFTEFFREHYKVFCEVNIAVPYSEIRHLFDSNSILFDTGIAADLNLLVTEYKKSIKFFRKKDIKGAIRILNPYLGNKGYLKYDARNNSLINMVNDYAFFLEQDAKYDESIELLNYIVSQVPNRVVAFINLGDAYYGNNETDKAKQAYQAYVDLMKKVGKEKKIPKRVYDRLN